MNFRHLRTIALSIGLGLPLAVFASQNQEARITRISHDAQLIAPNGATRAAKALDIVREGETVRTSAASRVELTFSDQTIARLGSNCSLGLKNGSHDLELKEGAVLLQVPSSAHGTKIQTAEFAAVLPGTTIVFESYPTHYKFLVLDGTGRLFRPAHLGDSVLVNAGQMVFGQPKGAVSDPVDFDLGHFLKSCRFIIDYPPLSSTAAMTAQSQKQQTDKSAKNLLDTNLVIFGGGTLVSLVDPAKKEALDLPPARANAAAPSNDLGTVEKLKPAKSAVHPKASPKPNDQSQ